MLFNSLEFLVFLPTVFFLYWFVAASRLRLQNVLVLAASYIFYGWWDWRFLGLIILSTLVDYAVGRGLARVDEQLRRRLLLSFSLVTNLGLLGFFKYWNFFIDSWIASWASLGVDLQPGTLQIILPVGISFYTFQTLSYTIDVYRRKIEPDTDFISFAAFVAFFPQLVAGPIERAANLLPQFLKPRRFSLADGEEGLRQIVWGLFKKIVIADQLAPHVNLIFSTWETQPGAVLCLGAVFFAIQIYCDFSGYSDIAIGTARLFGFRLMTNFRYPYFSRDIGEFWRRWHISLSTWFRDYVYIPLGGSRGGSMKTARNVLIVFAVSGMWHGANWTFIVWGVLHACYFLPSILRQQHRNYLDEAASGALWPGAREFLNILLTFSLVCVAWVFFRAENLSDATGYLSAMLPGAGFFGGGLTALFVPSALIVLLLVVEWVSREKPFPLSEPVWPSWVQASVCFVLLYSCVITSDSTAEFIYFQF